MLLVLVLLLVCAGMAQGRSAKVATGLTGAPGEGTCADCHEPAGGGSGCVCITVPYCYEPGETLEGITTQYLGSPDAWRENWRLNPDVADPHRLSPGQRIRVILSRRTAEITAISKDVHEKPYPEPWIPANVGDRLKERDGVRTKAASSAELAFQDGSMLRIGEESVVFLRDTGSRLEGVSRNSLEIRQGQADVESRPTSALPSDIEMKSLNRLHQPKRAASGPVGRVL